MELLVLSPNCPLGLQQGTYEVGGLIPSFVENLVVYHRADYGVLTKTRDEMEAYDTTEFREKHTASELMAVRGCARIIAEGECPFWRFDESQNSIISTVNSIVERQDES